MTCARHTDLSNWAKSPRKPHSFNFQLPKSRLSVTCICFWRWLAVWVKIFGLHDLKHGRDWKRIFTTNKHYEPVAWTALSTAKDWKRSISASCGGIFHDEVDLTLQQQLKYAAVFTQCPGWRRLPKSLFSQTVIQTQIASEKEGKSMGKAQSCFTPSSSMSMRAVQLHMHLHENQWVSLPSYIRSALLAIEQAAYTESRRLHAGK